MKKLLVGPVEIPDFVLNAMNYPSFSHRTPEYEEIQKKVERQMQQIFGTQEDILLLASSGTGGMEASIVSCFSAGDHVLVPLMGNFSRQFSAMAKAFGLNVEEIEFDYGQSADPEKVQASIRPDTKGVLLTHNESSTGVMNDLEAFGQITKGTNAILVVDSVSGAGGLPLFMDQWGVDVLVTASQKCLMSPAGLSMISLSEKAWHHSKSSSLPKYYFDLKRYKEFNQKHQTPMTPAIYTILATSAALDFMENVGFENIWKRTSATSNQLREGLLHLGFKLFAKEDALASDTLTTVYLEGKANMLLAELKKKGFMVGGGLAPFAEDTLRIGTMGYVFEKDIRDLLQAMEEVNHESLS